VGGNKEEVQGEEGAPCQVSARYEAPEAKWLLEPLVLQATTTGPILQEWFTIAPVMSNRHRDLRQRHPDREVVDHTRGKT
jgi:hypothetical protein